MDQLPVEIEQRKPPTDRAGFLYRLGIYCIGIAIGFMILGMFRARGSVEARRREAARAAAEAQPATTAPLPKISAQQPEPGR
ncbi:MAG: hypothetical protein ACREJD_04265 [Phycisphaerales bacterium]